MHPIEQRLRQSRARLRRMHHGMDHAHMVSLGKSAPGGMHVYPLAIGTLAPGLNRARSPQR